MTARTPATVLPPQPSPGDESRSPRAAVPPGGVASSRASFAECFSLRAAFGSGAAVCVPDCSAFGGGMPACAECHPATPKEVQK